MSELFTRDTWMAVADELRGGAGKWWQEHREDLVGLGAEEMTQVATALRDGKQTDAKMVIAGHMDPADFIAYVKGTTAQLEGIARRRAKIMEALEDLGMRSAKIIGKAVLAAIGI